MLYTKYLQKYFRVKIHIFVTSVELNTVTKQTTVRAVRTPCLWFILIIAVFLFYLQLLLIGRLLKNTKHAPRPFQPQSFCGHFVARKARKNVLFVNFPFQGTGSRDELVNWNLVDMNG
jgi:hypothetical protein